MGTWGPAIFSDDTAGDVRDAYRRRVADGMDGAASTDELIKEWLQNVVEDDPEVFVFWLALAATQSKAGRLEDRVRDKALEIIDSGLDLERWRETGNEKQRQKHLMKLREQLTRPQPAPKRIRVERSYTPDFQDGDYVAFRLSNEEIVIMFVERVEPDERCVVSFLDWKDKELPNVDRMRDLPKKVLEGQHSETAVSVYAMKKKAIPLDRLEVLDVPDDSRERQEDVRGLVWWWDNLEFFVLNEFNWDRPSDSSGQEILSSFHPAEARRIVDAFQQHCGQERSHRFVEQLNASGRYEGRLRFWQEQLWMTFVASFEGDLPQSAVEIAELFDSARGP